MGDLTKHGDPEEATVLADELADVDIPVVCVLGNHDYLNRPGFYRGTVSTVAGDAGCCCAAA